VAVLRALLILTAVSALAALPCLVLLLISCDDMFDAIARAVRRRRKRRRRIHDPSLSRRQRRRLSRLDRCFGPELAPEGDPVWPPIEKIAADLRRLRRQRTGIALRSPVWFAAIEKAYDDRLRLACERLDIDEHLDELTGVDREIERVRLEGELEAAGLTLHGYEAAAS
jgi:hypothetical protein